MQAAGRHRLRGQHAQVEARLLPVAELAVRAEDAEIDAIDHLPRQRRHQCQARAEVGRLWPPARRLQDRSLHQRHGKRTGGLEDFPLMGDVVEHVLVARVDGQLLLAAEHEHRRTVEHQRPKCAQLDVLQRIHRLVSGNRRKYAHRVAFGVVQQRRASHRQVGDAPGAAEVAEIDDALQLPLSRIVTTPDRVVIGDIQMYRLVRQQAGQRLQALVCLAGDTLHLLTPRALLEGWQQLLDQQLAVTRVPLQRTLQAWMLETGQGSIDAAAKPPSSATRRGDRCLRRVNGWPSM